MAAADHLQLQMFMRPHEVLGTVDRSIDYGRVEFLKDRLSSDVLAQASKRGTASENVRGLPSGPSLRESVADHGVQKPIILQHVGVDRSVEGQSVGARIVMGNGHHRLASALDAEKQGGPHQYIPVVHDDDYMGKYLGDTFGLPRD